MKDRPNFFIVGSPKSGTTSLYEYLKDIPGIYMSPEKEPRYFHKKNSELNLKGISNESKYLKLFKNVKDEKVIGEASPTYLLDPESAELIQKFNPSVFVFILEAITSLNDLVSLPFDTRNKYCENALSTGSRRIIIILDSGLNFRISSADSGSNK